MAISVRGGAPVLSAVISNPVSVTLTGTQQPQAGDLLVIIHFNDFYAATAMPTPTVGGSTSGVTAITNGSADGGTNQAHIKAYTYAVGSTGDLTVSVTESAPGDEDKGLAVYVLSGADTVTPIDGGSSGAAGAFFTTGQSPQPAPSVTPSGTDAFLIVHVNSGTGASAAGYTPPASPYAELYDGNATGGMSYTGGTEQLTTSGATGTRSFTCNPVPWGAVTLAIKTASGASAPIDAGPYEPQFPPGLIAPNGRFAPYPWEIPTAVADTPVPLTDTGAAADGTPAVTAAVPVSDSGLGADALTAAATVPLTDAGSGADAITVTVPVAVADSGSGSDTAIAGIGIAISDTGTGSDAITIAAAVPAADTGAGTDAVTATAATPLADTGSGSDVVTAAATVPLTDSGSGADSLAAGVPISVADTGSAADAVALTSITVPVAESGSASDLGRATAATVPLSDTASGSDALTALVALALAETAAAADALSVVRQISIADTGSAADSASAQQQTSSQINVADTGSGADYIRVLLHRPDSGTTPRPGSGTTGRPYSGITRRF